MHSLNSLSFDQTFDFFLTNWSKNSFAGFKFFFVLDRNVTKTVFFRVDGLRRCDVVVVVFVVFVVVVVFVAPSSLTD